MGTASSIKRKLTSCALIILTCVAAISCRVYSEVGSGGPPKMPYRGVIYSNDINSISFFNDGKNLDIEWTDSLTNEFSVIGATTNRYFIHNNPSGFYRVAVTNLQFISPRRH